MPAPHQQTRRTLQSARTSLAPADVLARALAYFTERPDVYTAFAEHEGPNHVVLRGQGGEEIALAAHAAADGATEVTGSSYLFDAHVARFLATLPPAPPLDAAPAADAAPVAAPDGEGA